MLQVEIASPFYPAPNGSPLQLGSIWYGVAGQNPVTHPVTVYWDAAGTQPAKQPISVMYGRPVNNGAPAAIYINGDYSKLIQDAQGRQVLYAPSLSVRKRQRVAIMDFPGVYGDGVHDDTAGILAAIADASAANCDLIWNGNCTYAVGAQLVQPQSQAWIGEGGQRATTILKCFNGDLIVPGSLGTLENLNLECQGATYSGRGIHVTNGFSIRINRVRVDQSAGVSLEFDPLIGGGSHISDFEASTTNQTVVPAIKIQDNTSPSPKFFEGIWLSGGLFDLSGGGNGSSLTNFYIRNFVLAAPDYPAYTHASLLFHAENGRVASISDTTTISGSDNEFANIAFSGPVVLDKAQGNKLTGCSFGAGCTETAGTCQYNAWTDQGQAYTPVWNQPSGTQPSLGDGTLTGFYQREGYTCRVIVRLVMGAGTTYGNNGSAYQISLPFAGHVARDQKGIPALVTIGATSYPVWVTIGAGQSVLTMGSNGQSVRSTYPGAWAAGDAIDLSLTYLTK